MDKTQKDRLDQIIETLATRNSGKETVENIHRIRVSELVWYLKILQRYANDD